MEIKKRKFNYWNFWTESIRISFRQIVEFKTNFYSSLGLDVVYFIITVFFAYIFSSFGGDVVGWTFVEFVLFGFLFSILTDLSGFFWYGYNQNLYMQIKTGNINSYLTKPGNPLLVYLLKPRYNPLVFVLTDIVLYGTFFYFVGNFELINIFYGALISFVLIFLIALVPSFFNSFSWLLIESGNFLNNIIYWNSIHKTIRMYPGQFFSGNNVLYFLLGLFPAFYIGLILVPVISFGDFSFFYNHNFTWVIISIILMILIMILNWKIGLKKYEAFG